MPRLPTTDLTSDAIKAFLGITGEVTLDDICKSDRVRGEYFDINYLHGMAQAYYGLLSALAGFPLAPASIREGVRLAPQDISNFRNYGYDVTGYSIIAFSGEHNDNKILKYNNDEYWNDFYSAPIRDMRTAVRAPDGVLWIGGQVSIFVYANERGLFSFNGSTWRRYTTPEITGQYVYAIELGTDPYMWIGTEHGFSIFDRTTYTFTHYYIGAGTVPTGKLQSNVITCFAYNSNDESMWVGTVNGLIHITDIADPAGWNLLQVADGLIDNNVKCLMVGPDGDCWAGFDGHGMVRITESGGVYTFDNINTGSVSGLVTNHILKIAIDPDTYEVWAATNNGIQYFHWNLACNDVTILSTTEGLPSNYVYTVRRDSDNRKWFGFDDHIGMIVDIDDEIRVWGQWHGGDSLNIHEFLVDYEPQQVFNEVVIGTQTWMSDNWRGNKRFMFGTGEKSKVYNYDEYNREYYGGLFTWNQVNDPSFCPTGWHVPSFAEWWEMITYLGGTTAAGNALKARSFGWSSVLPTVTDSTGFAALGSGYANVAGYYDINEMTAFWTSDENEDDTDDGVAIGFYYNRQDAYIEAHKKDTYWFPVRLIKTVTEQIYTCCATYTPDFASHSADHAMFLSAGLLELGTGTIGDYVIEWHEGAVDGTIVFTTGVTADPGEVQAQHPFVDEVVFAGTLYPVIKYIYVNTFKYTSEYDGVSRYSPDLINCLDPIIVDAIECDTVLGADTLYPYYLSYIKDVSLEDKSRSLRYNICGPGMKYLAVEFQGYSVADQLKIYYCTLADPTGTLIDNWVHGNRGVGGVALTNNLYPANYPTDPRIALYGITGQSPLCFITNISAFTFVAGDYLRIEIIGAVYESETPNDTNWYIKLKSLDALAETFISTNDLYKINSVPAISYLGDPDCRYEITYDTVESGTIPSRTTPGVPDLFKYLYFWNGWSGNPSGNNLTSPVILGDPWKYTGSNFGMYSSPDWNTKENLDAGETISIQKTGDDYILTFTDIDDYNAFKSQLAAWQAHSSYATWSGLTDTDSRYYAYLMFYFTIAENTGDNTGTTYIIQLHPTSTITEDDGNQKITFTCVVPVNNYPDPGACNSVGTVVASAIGSMNTTKNRANFGPTHTHIRYKGWLYMSWPYYYSDAYATREFYGMWFIDDCFVDGLIDMEALGFMKGVFPGGAYYTNMWLLPQYMDKVTFTDITDHAARLANWKLERKTFLRTDDPADTAWETVYEIP